MPIINNVNQFTDRITVQKKDGYTTGPNGTKIPKYTDLKTVWIAPRTQFVSEIKSTVLTTYQDTVDIVLRHEVTSDITADMIILWNEIKYDIVKINRDISEKKYDVLILKLSK
jgi:SPP1 family predicted phage head-tail adaptor